MSAEQGWLSRSRLRYLIDTYFSEIIGGDAYLARRVIGECTPREKSRIAQLPILKTDQFYHIGHRAAVGYLEVRPERIPREFIDVLSSVLCREFCALNAEPKNVDQASRAISHWVRNGEGSPFAILNGTPLRVSELSLEHQMSRMNPDDPACAERAGSFLRGGAQRDWDVVRDIAISRGVESELVATLEGGISLITLVGAAGDGKTTLLRRVALGLLERGWRVLWAEALDRRPFAPLPSLETGARVRTCLLVDNADMATSYPRLEADIHANPGLHVILCSRAYQWERRRERFQRALSVLVSRLEHDTEIEALADRILLWRAAVAPQTRDDLIRSIREAVGSEHPHMLAAMMSATRGKNFRTIVDGIIHDFDDADDAWTLQQVACGALLNDLCDGRAGRLPGRIFHKLIESRGFARDKKLREISSEVLPLRSPTKNYPTEYDLRHPDISLQVLRRYFALAGTTDALDAEGLAGVLGDIVKAESDLAQLALGAAATARLPYSSRVLNLLLAKFKEPERSLERDLGRELARAILAKFGSYERDVQVRSSILTQWASAEAAGPDDTLLDGMGYRSDALFQAATELRPLIDFAPISWAAAASRRGSYGSWTNPEPNSARAIYREAWQRGVRSEALMSQWFSFELGLGQTGDTSTEYTCRWIAWQCLSEKLQGPHIVGLWIRLEAEAKQFAAGRRIARQAWNSGYRSREFITTWMKLAELDNDVEGVREIAREAWQAGERSREFLIPWIKAESASDSEAARVIARHAWIIGNRAPELLMAWMGLEEAAGNYGTEKLEEFSALWIARVARRESPPDGHFTIACMRMEESHGDLELARRIAREAWTANERSVDFLLFWLNFEKRHDNVGSAEGSDKFTANWIRREALRSGVKDKRVMTALGGGDPLCTIDADGRSEDP